LEYFSGKARLERALTESGLSYAILRPAVIFGVEDILINNIAWMLRKLPVFGVFGDGQYRLQPIYVEDLAQLAVEQGEKTENTISNAIGPETFTYRELVRTIGAAIGKQRRIISIPPRLGYWAGNRRFDGRSALRGSAARRVNAADRLGEGTRRCTGSPLRQRIRAAQIMQYQPRIARRPSVSIAWLFTTRLPPGR
jgi:uncharacterized protein YbjT (DUF2867 family)